MRHVGYFGNSATYILMGRFEVQISKTLSLVDPCSLTKSNTYLCSLARMTI